MRYSLPALALAALATTFSGCNKVSSSTPAAPVAEAGNSVKTGTGEAAPQTAKRAADVGLQILDWDGLQQLLAQHKGKVIVLDCWSTSCVPCIKEFPNLVALHHQHSPDDLACISLSFDYEGIGRPEDEHSRVLAFLQKHKATFDNVLSRLDSDALTAKLEIPSIPAVFVYDRQGQLHKRFDNRHASKSGGPFTYEQVGAVVADLLGGRAESAE